MYASWGHLPRQPPLQLPACRLPGLVKALWGLPVGCPLGLLPGSVSTSSQSTGAKCEPVTPQVMEGLQNSSRGLAGWAEPGRGADLSRAAWAGFSHSSQVRCMQKFQNYRLFKFPFQSR